MDDGPDVESPKTPAAMGPKEEHVADDESPRVSATVKANQGTAARFKASGRWATRSRRRDHAHSVP
jgi:hypothetical protein